MSDSKTLDLETARFEPQGDLDRLRRSMLVVGFIGAAATLALGLPKLGGEHAVEFFRPYLIAWLLWLGVALGLLGLGMLNHLSGGYWGVVMRRVFEAAGRTLPVLLVLGVPIVFGLGDLYPWADPEIVANDELIRYKTPYLNAGGFILRGVIYFAIWSLLAFMLSRHSNRHDETGERGHQVAMQRWSAAGLVLYILTGTFASVDWIMSLEPHWFSSLFGAAFVAGHALGALAFSVPILIFLSRRKPLENLVKKREFHDYGKLMLTFVMVWGYFTVSQYLIIWSGNLPEEVPWYLYRTANGWYAVSFFLMVGHFAVPFLVLLSADIKKRPRLLVWVAVWLLLMRWLDLYWQVSPSVSHGEVAFGPLDLTTPVAIGGFWLWFLIGQLKNRAIVPVHEPALKEAMAHG